MEAGPLALGIACHHFTVADPPTAGNHDGLHMLTTAKQDYLLCEVGRRNGSGKTAIEDLQIGGPAGRQPPD